ncbi:hypothetical protein KEM55_002122 [Ascosphaera atra]|nr:hypothetical protein KEM55_002122 [Ascosphaera atra]
MVANGGAMWSQPGFHVNIGAGATAAINPAVLGQTEFLFSSLPPAPADLGAALPSLVRSSSLSASDVDVARKLKAKSSTTRMPESGERKEVWGLGERSMGEPEGTSPEKN